MNDQVCAVKEGMDACVKSFVCKFHRLSKSRLDSNVKSYVYDLVDGELGAKL